METTIIRKKHQIRLIIGCLLSGIFFSGCVDDDVKGNFYTSSGFTITEYLENNVHEYGYFLEIVEKAKLKSMLDAYGTYTCFLPTNDAINTYLSENGFASLQDLPDEKIMEIAKTHLLEQAYQKNELELSGAIPTPNMNYRYLVITVSDEKDEQGNKKVLVNNSAVIQQSVSEVPNENPEEDPYLITNGIMHVVDAVLQPSNAQIPDLMAENDRISLFCEALVATGLADSLRRIEDADYVQEEFENLIDNNGGTFPGPEKRLFGYTVFVETNDVLARYGITDLASMKQKAAEFYPENSEITDITDRRNSLNRFIAYHLVNKMIRADQFVFSFNSTPDAELFEYIETMCPYAMLKVESYDGLRINRKRNRQTGVVEMPGIKLLTSVEAENDQNALNGMYYYVEDILVYSDDVRNIVLNDRLRFDVLSLLPELMTNGVRQSSGYTAIPLGYCEYLNFSAETKIFILDPHDTWNNYQGDELMALGQYDFTLRLPPVPYDGTYEIRFGFTANTSRGIAQFYLGTEDEKNRNRLSPVGIPLDLRMLGTDPRIGWVADSESDESVGIENDKLMRNRGFMKAPDTFQAMKGTAFKVARNDDGALRRIVGAFQMSSTETYYLRFKSTLDDSKAQFMFDYLEIVPRTVYASADGEDRH